MLPATAGRSIVVPEATNDVDDLNTAISDSYWLRRLWSKTPVWLRIMWAAALLILAFSGVVTILNSARERSARNSDPSYQTAIHVTPEGTPVAIAPVDCVPSMPTAGLGQTLVWADAIAVRLVRVQVSDNQRDVRVTLDVERRGPWPAEWSPHPITATLLLGESTSRTQVTTWQLAPAGQLIEVPALGRPMVTTAVSAHLTGASSAEPSVVLVRITPGYRARNVNTVLCWAVPVSAAA